MSLQSALSFWVAAAKDPSLAVLVSQALTGKSGEEAATAFAEFGKSRGFDFTVAEATLARARVLKASQMSDLELDGVTGGVSDGNPNLDPNNLYGPYFDDPNKKLQETASRG